MTERDMCETSPCGFVMFCPGPYRLDSRPTHALLAGCDASHASSARSCRSLARPYGEIGAGTQRSVTGRSSLPACTPPAELARKKRPEVRAACGLLVSAAP